MLYTHVFPLLLAVVFGPALSQVSAPRAPSALASPAASRSEVRLAWTAAGDAVDGYVIERKPLGGAYAAHGTSAQPAASDAAIDRYETYVYRVRAYRDVESAARPGTKERVTSPPSNEVTVGPPPVGFHPVATAPPNRAGDFGSQISMAFDADGDPALAYLFANPDGNDDPRDGQMLFSAWDRAKYRWKAAIQVETVGASPNSFGDYSVSLAFDASTGTFGLAYVKMVLPGDEPLHEIHLATSRDGGSTWAHELIQRGELSSNPSLAMASGRTHLTYHSNDEVHYRTRSGASGPFSDALAPKAEGAVISRINSGVVLDGNGQPAVHYWLDYTERVRVVVAYWRPGESSAVEALVSESGSDDVEASMTFSGTKPRVMAQIRRTDNYEDTLWFTASDNGRSWSAPVLVPRDGGENWAFPVSLGIDAKGGAAAALAVNVSSGGALGRPKLVRSDDLKSWRVSSPDRDRVFIGSPIWHTRLLVMGNDKLYIAFQNHNDKIRIPAGVLLWREP